MRKEGPSLPFLSPIPLGDFLVKALFSVDGGQSRVLGKGVMVCSATDVENVWLLVCCVLLFKDA